MTGMRMSCSYTLRITEQCESIDGDLAHQLGETLHDSTTLKRLEIVNHPIGTVEAIAIVKPIHGSKSLEKLSVIDCNIGSEGGSLSCPGIV